MFYILGLIKIFLNWTVINLCNMVGLRDLSYTTIEITCDNSPCLTLCWGDTFVYIHNNLNSEIFTKVLLYYNIIILKYKIYKI